MTCSKVYWRWAESGCLISIGKNLSCESLPKFPAWNAFDKASRPQINLAERNIGKVWPFCQIGEKKGQKYSSEDQKVPGADTILCFGFVQCNEIKSLLSCLVENNEEISPL